MKYDIVGHKHEQKKKSIIHAETLHEKAQIHKQKQDVTDKQSCSLNYVNCRNEKAVVGNTKDMIGTKTKQYRSNVVDTVTKPYNNMSYSKYKYIRSEKALPLTRNQLSQDQKMCLEPGSVNTHMNTVSRPPSQDSQFHKAIASNVGRLNNVSTQKPDHMRAKSSATSVHLSPKYLSTKHKLVRQPLDNPDVITQEKDCQSLFKSRFKLVKPTENGTAQSTRIQTRHKLIKRNTPVAETHMNRQQNKSKANSHSGSTKVVATKHKLVRRRLSEIKSSINCKSQSPLLQTKHKLVKHARTIAQNKLSIGQHVHSKDNTIRSSSTRLVATRHKLVRRRLSRGTPTESVTLGSTITPVVRQSKFKIVKRTRSQIIRKNTSAMSTPSKCLATPKQVRVLFKTRRTKFSLVNSHMGKWHQILLAYFKIRIFILKKKPRPF